MPTARPFARRDKRQLWVSWRISLERNLTTSSAVQTNHVCTGCFLIDLDERMVSTCTSTRFLACNNLSPRKSVTPAATLDGAQEVFDLSIECRRLFQIDRMAGIGTDPETSVRKHRFEHQVGLEAADILVAHGEQYRNRHVRQLIAQIMQ